MSLAAYLVVGLLTAVSLAFLTLSGYRAICLGLGDVYAALIVGCTYFMFALVAMLAIQMRRR